MILLRAWSRARRSGRSQPPASRLPGGLCGAAGGQRRAARQGRYAHREQPAPGTPGRRAAALHLRQEVREARCRRTATGVRGSRGGGNRGGRSRGYRRPGAARTVGVGPEAPGRAAQPGAPARAPAAYRADHRARQHGVCVRPRADGAHRRRPQRAAGHRSGAAAGAGHGAPEVRVPDLCGGRRAGARAGAPDRGRAADRGRAGAGADRQVRRPLSTVHCTASHGSTPARAWTCIVPRWRAGWARRRFI